MVDFGVARQLFEQTENRRLRQAGTDDQAVGRVVIDDSQRLFARLRAGQLDAVIAADEAPDRVEGQAAAVEHDKPA